MFANYEPLFNVSVESIGKPTSEGPRMVLRESLNSILGAVAMGQSILSLQNKILGVRVGFGTNCLFCVAHSPPKSHYAFLCYHPHFSH